VTDILIAYKSMLMTTLSILGPRKIVHAEKFLRIGPALRTNIQTRPSILPYAGSNKWYGTLGLGQPSLPSLREDQLWLERQRRICFILLVDKRVGVRLKLVWSLDNACHTLVLLWSGCLIKRRYVKCPLSFPLLVPSVVVVNESPALASSYDVRLI